MRITLNGEPREVADGQSVASLLADLGIPAERVAVELNLKVVDRQTFPGTPLREGDRVEVIGFIGGGGKWVVKDDRVAVAGMARPRRLPGGTGTDHGLNQSQE